MTAGHVSFLFNLLLSSIGYRNILYKIICRSILSVLFFFFALSSQITHLKFVSSVLPTNSFVSYLVGYFFFFLSEKTSLIVIKHFYDAMMLVLLAALLDYI